MFCKRFVFYFTGGLTTLKTFSKHVTTFAKNVSKHFNIEHDTKISEWLLREKNMKHFCKKCLKRFLLCFT